MTKPREIYEKIMPYFDSLEAIIITGMRRTGKTTLLHLVFDQIKALPDMAGEPLPLTGFVPEGFIRRTDVLSVWAAGVKGTAGWNI